MSGTGVAGAVDPIGAAGTRRPAGTVCLILPEGIDDAAAPSGGNYYDRRISDGLADIGWSVQERPVPGSWPWPTEAAHAALGKVVAGVPDGGVVMIDGLIASAAPEVLGPESSRLRQVVLVHMPLGEGESGQHRPGTRTRERAALSAAAAVITTSTWTKRRLIFRYGLQPERIHVVEPGVDFAERATGTAAGGQLLCVGVVAPHKGHDVLLKALEMIKDRSWHCRCVGSLERDPPFVGELREAATLAGIGERVEFVGARTGAGLRSEYGAADLLVHPSHNETYGMVITEALAHGVPVLATDVGGVPEALGHGAGGQRPGLLLPAGDPTALADALRGWLDSSELRDHLRKTAGERRSTLVEWPTTSKRISRILDEVRS